MNLCTNAHQAMCGSRGVLTVALEPVEVDEETAWLEGSPAAGQYVRLMVHDTGVGIDPANRQQIFEPFYTTRKVGKGIGLGLAVAYFIITECHGGTMTVESEPGKGTKFIIHLPRGQA